MTRVTYVSGGGTGIGRATATAGHVTAQIVQVNGGALPGRG